jgi:hypothetical protein
VRYVGKSVNPDYRYKHHVSRYELERVPGYKSNWILSLLNRGEKPVMKIIDMVAPGDDWAAAEVRWIEYYRSLGCRLTNSGYGGEGPHGKVVSDETKAKIRASKQHISDDTRYRLSVAMMGNTNFAGHTHTPEVREQISQKLKGHPVSDETRALWRKQRKGRKQSPETRERMRQAQAERRERERLAKEAGDSVA